MRFAKRVIPAASDIQIGTFVLIASNQPSCADLQPLSGGSLTSGPQWIHARKCRSIRGSAERSRSARLEIRIQLNERSRPRMACAVGRTDTVRDILNPDLGAASRRPLALGYEFFTRGEYVHRGALNGTDDPGKRIGSDEHQGDPPRLRLPARDRQGLPKLPWGQAGWAC